MGLTRDFKQTIKERAEQDPQFVQAMLNEAITLFLSGEPQTSRLILRDVVNATCGFEQLAAATQTPVKSLHRMLSQNGNPGMDNLAVIFEAMQQELNVRVDVHFVSVKPQKQGLAAKSGGNKNKLNAVRA